MQGQRATKPTQQHSGSVSSLNTNSSSVPPVLDLTKYSSFFKSLPLISPNERYLTYDRTTLIDFIISKLPYEYHEDFRRLALLLHTHISLHTQNYSTIIGQHFDVFGSASGHPSQHTDHEQMVSTIHHTTARGHSSYPLSTQRSASDLSSGGGQRQDLRRSVHGVHTVGTRRSSIHQDDRSLLSDAQVGDASGGDTMAIPPWLLSNNLTGYLLYPNPPIELCDDVSNALLPFFYHQSWVFLRQPTIPRLIRRLHGLSPASAFIHMLTEMLSKAGFINGSLYLFSLAGFHSHLQKRTLLNKFRAEFERLAMINTKIAAFTTRLANELPPASSSSVNLYQAHQYRQQYYNGTYGSQQSHLQTLLSQRSEIQSALHQLYILWKAHSTDPQVPLTLYCRCTLCQHPPLMPLPQDLPIALLHFYPYMAMDRLFMQENSALWCDSRLGFSTDDESSSTSTSPERDQNTKKASPSASTLCMGGSKDHGTVAPVNSNVLCFYRGIRTHCRTSFFFREKILILASILLAFLVSVLPKRLALRIYPSLEMFTFEQVPIWLTTSDLDKLVSSGFGAEHKETSTTANDACIPSLPENQQWSPNNDSNHTEDLEFSSHDRPSGYDLTTGDMNSNVQSIPPRAVMQFTKPVTIRDMRSRQEQMDELALTWKLSTKHNIRTIFIRSPNIARLLMRLVEAIYKLTVIRYMIYFISFFGSIKFPRIIIPSVFKIYDPVQEYVDITLGSNGNITTPMPRQTSPPASSDSGLPSGAGAGEKRGMDGNTTSISRGPSSPTRYTEDSLSDSRGVISLDMFLTIKLYDFSSVIRFFDKLVGNLVNAHRSTPKTDSLHSSAAEKRSPPGQETTTKGLPHDTPVCLPLSTWSLIRLTLAMWLYRTIHLLRWLFSRQSFYYHSADEVLYISMAPTSTIDNMTGNGVGKSGKPHGKGIQDSTETASEPRLVTIIADALSRVFPSESAVKSTSQTSASVLSALVDDARSGGSTSRHERRRQSSSSLHNTSQSSLDARASSPSSCSIDIPHTNTSILLTIYKSLPLFLIHGTTPETIITPHVHKRNQTIIYMVTILLIIICFGFNFDFSVLLTRIFFTLLHNISVIFFSILLSIQFGLLSLISFLTIHSSVITELFVNGICIYPLGMDQFGHRALPLLLRLESIDDLVSDTSSIGTIPQMYDLQQTYPGLSLDELIDMGVFSSSFVPSNAVDKDDNSNLQRGMASPMCPSDSVCGNRSAMEGFNAYATSQQSSTSATSSASPFFQSKGLGPSGFPTVVPGISLLDVYSPIVKWLDNPKTLFLWETPVAFTMPAMTPADIFQHKRVILWALHDYLSKKQGGLYYSSSVPQSWSTGTTSSGADRAMPPLHHFHPQSSSALPIYLANTRLLSPVSLENSGQHFLLIPPLPITSAVPTPQSLTADLYTFRLSEVIVQSRSILKQAIRLTINKNAAMLGSSRIMKDVDEILDLYRFSSLYPSSPVFGDDGVSHDNLFLWFGSNSKDLVIPTSRADTILGRQSSQYSQKHQHQQQQYQKQSKSDASSSPSVLSPFHSRRTPLPHQQRLEQTQTQTPLPQHDITLTVLTWPQFLTISPIPPISTIYYSVLSLFTSSMNLIISTIAILLSTTPVKGFTYYDYYTESLFMTSPTTMGIVGSPLTAFDTLYPADLTNTQSFKSRLPDALLKLQGLGSNSNSTVGTDSHQPLSHPDIISLSNNSHSQDSVGNRDTNASTATTTANTTSTAPHLGGSHHQLANSFHSSSIIFSIYHALVSWTLSFVSYTAIACSVLTTALVCLAWPIIYILTHALVLLIYRVYQLISIIPWLHFAAQSVLKWVTSTTIWIIISLSSLAVSMNHYIWGPRMFFFAYPFLSASMTSPGTMKVTVPESILLSSIVIPPLPAPTALGATLSAKSSYPSTTAAMMASLFSFMTPLFPFNRLGQAVSLSDDVQLSNPMITLLYTISQAFQVYMYHPFEYLLYSQVWSSESLYFNETGDLLLDLLQNIVVVLINVLNLSWMTIKSLLVMAYVNTVLLVVHFFSKLFLLYLLFFFIIFMIWMTFHDVLHSFVQNHHNPTGQAMACPPASITPVSTQTTVDPISPSSSSSLLSTRDQSTTSLSPHSTLHHSNSTSSVRQSSGSSGSEPSRSRSDLNRSRSQSLSRLQRRASHGALPSFTGTTTTNAQASVDASPQHTGGDLIPFARDGLALDYLIKQLTEQETLQAVMALGISLYLLHQMQTRSAVGSGSSAGIGSGVDQTINLSTYSRTRWKWVNELETMLFEQRYHAVLPPALRNELLPFSRSSLRRLTAMSNSNNPSQSLQRHDSSLYYQSQQIASLGNALPYITTGDGYNHQPPVEITNGISILLHLQLVTIDFVSGSPQGAKGTHLLPVHPSDARNESRGSNGNRASIETTLQQQGYQRRSQSQILSGTLHLPTTQSHTTSTATATGGGLTLSSVDMADDPLNVLSTTGMISPITTTSTTTATTTAASHPSMEPNTTTTATGIPAISTDPSLSSNQGIESANTTTTSMTAAITQQLVREIFIMARRLFHRKKLSKIIDQLISDLQSGAFTKQGGDNDITATAAAATTTTTTAATTTITTASRAQLQAYQRTLSYYSGILAYQNQVKSLLKSRFKLLNQLHKIQRNSLSNLNITVLPIKSCLETLNRNWKGSTVVPEYHIN